MPSPHPRSKVSRHGPAGRDPRKSVSSARWRGDSPRTPVGRFANPVTCQTVSCRVWWSKAIVTPMINPPSPRPTRQPFRVQPASCSRHSCRRGRWHDDIGAGSVAAERAILVGWFVDSDCSRRHCPAGCNCRFGHRVQSLRSRQR